MYRRRRVQRDKMAFGFDSFLDVVANVIGIILRLILVAWVGARAYTSAMQWKDEPPVDAKNVASTAPPRDDKPHPLEDHIAEAKTELDDARKKLAAYVSHLDAARAKADAARSGLDSLKKEEFRLTSLDKMPPVPSKEKLNLPAFSTEELKERSRLLMEKIAELEKTPLPKKLLRFRTPVSRVLQTEELMFECRGGRVTYVDVPAFLLEIRATVDDAKYREIAKLKTWSSATSTVGSFRVRYTFNTEESLFSASTRVQLTQWVVEPITPLRGEDAVAALKPASEFRRIADAIDPNQTAVTFWVYPDSFALFRTLRDYLYEDGIEVAGRPIPFDQPIGASIHGTKSRGQ